MERAPKHVYTEEFKREAVKMAKEAGLSIAEVARRLSVNKSTLRYWMTEEEHGVRSRENKRAITAEDMEIARLKAENAELKMERDILKKAAAYFAKESLKGTRS